MLLCSLQTFRSYASSSIFIGPDFCRQPLNFTKRHFFSSFTSRSKPQQKPTDATQQNSCNTQRNSQHNSINKAQLMQLSGMYCNTHNNTFHNFSYVGAHSGPKTFHKAPTLVCGECCHNSSYYVLSQRPLPLNPHTLNMGRQWCLSHPSMPLIISLNKFFIIIVPLFLFLCSVSTTSLNLIKALVSSSLLHL